MGNKNTKQNQLNYDAHDWTLIDKAQIYQVMKSNKGQLGQLYHFSIKSDRTLDQQVQIYHNRRNEANWVKVIGAKIQKNGYGFCGTQQDATVLTERIHILLNGIGKLNQQQSNIVLFNSLKGFNDITKMVVPALINDKMIGFNEQGNTKVWINENFGMNYPAYYNKKNTLNEREVVNNLLDAIQDKTTFNNDYVNVLRNTNNLSNAINFVKSNSGISEAILNSNRINISRYLTSVNYVPLLQQSKPLLHNAIINNKIVIPVVSYPNYPTQQNYISTLNHNRPTVTQSYYKKPKISFVKNLNSTSQDLRNPPYVPPNLTTNSYIKPVHVIPSTLKY